MKIFVNGLPIQIVKDSTLESLIIQLGFQDMRIAVELNSEIINRSKYSNRVIVENDKIEIIQAIGGG